MARYFYVKHGLLSDVQVVDYPLKDGAQTALFKCPVRTAL
jgi:hypothetical protein